MTAASGVVLRGDPSAEREPLAHVHDLVSRSGTSFFWAMRLLPRPRREAMYAIYAFCREVDDIADGSAEPAAKLAALAAWRGVLGRGRSVALVGGLSKSSTLHSLPGYYGYFTAIWCLLPALAGLLL